MSRFVRVVALLLAFSRCSTLDEPGPGSVPEDLDPNATAEELYLQALELRTDGLMSVERFGVLQDTLGRAGDDERLCRDAVGPILRRTYEELRHGADADVLAGREGREYARRLNRAGRRAAAEYAEQAVLVAGMLGVPTSRTDAVLMVAVPVGGVIAVKVAKVGLKRAAFLLRRLRTADEVVDQAARLGFKATYAAGPAELRAFAGPSAVEAVEHIGSSGGAPLKGKLSPWNPRGAQDNCAACVAAVIRSGVEGAVKYTADDIERVIGYAGRERAFTEVQALGYIQQATGLVASAQPVAMKGGPVGHYAVMVGWQEGRYHHVIYGRVTPTGEVRLFDPQINVHMTYDEMLKNEGRARPYLLMGRPE